MEKPPPPTAPPTGTTALAAPGPSTAAERITNLDTVRGVATLGILLMNVVSFGLIDAAYANVEADGWNNFGDRAVGFLGEVLVDQKMMGLFSLLFGAGIVVFADRAEAKGRRALPLSLWRNLLLLGIGLAHSVLWVGDVLTIYALCAPVLLFTRKWSPRLLLGLGAGAMIVMGLLAFVAQGWVGDGGLGLGDYYWPAGNEMADGPGLFVLTDIFLRALGMMWIGVGLFRLDVVQGRLDAAFYRRMVVWGFGIGLPLALAGAVWHVGHEPSWEVALSTHGLNTLATVPMVLGYLGLVTLFNQRSETAAHRRLRAVGRMALTNYLTQTILGVVILGVVFDTSDFGRLGLFVFVLAVWGLQLAWSPWWLARFRFGPFEWAWRTLTYRSVQPIRRNPAG